MDILTGLSAATQAIGIAKELRDIDRSVDEASFKLKLADLTEALADTKIALADAKALVAELEHKLDIADNGEICPKCRTGRLTLTESEPVHDWALNRFGVENRIYSCAEDSCDFQETRLHDPNGLVARRVSGI
ncbi:hypothetical protein Q4560_11500 [Celeribacter halophilus]|uniref:Uncharacterized protein n=1 Tax=Celeribacter halophilus TaxID=576117 RepID=A0AAW7XWJ8_9RHOB|nr:hypothetical protein [Celeribacter halophilus]MDO6457020.1 hypothetical protein [Celeribacter halophilus]MDO6723890.1 hypothetical protein [Celeribacter halophilus]